MIGKKIAELRKKHNLSQESFGKLFGFKARTIGSWELGDREPSNETVKKIADYFGVSADYLLDTKENKKSNDDKIMDYLYDKGIIKNKEVVTQEELLDIIKYGIDLKIAMEKNKK